MNKVLKLFIIIICLIVFIFTFIYLLSNGYQKVKIKKVELTPTYTSEISTIDKNKIWIGTFNLVWNDFMNDVIKGEIEFEDGSSELAEQLNKQTFTVDQLNTNSYFKIHGEENLMLKNKIEEGIKQKFNETSNIIDKCDWNSKNGYILYAMLKKEFNYLEKFSTLDDNTFGDSEEKIKYFGLETDTSQNASINIEILFYNSDKDFAVKLKTKEGEEVYLYRTKEVDKSFEKSYQEMIEKQSKYTGDKKWQKNDIIKIPFIKIKDEINYDELCGKYIKGTNWYIKQALQTVDFELNNYGGSIKSEALIEATKQAVSNIGREFVFNDKFLLYLKEYEKQPYFALKIDNTDVLINSNEYEKIIN